MAKIELQGFSIQLDVQELVLKEKQIQHGQCTIIAKNSLNYDMSYLKKQYNQSEISVLYNNEVIFIGQIENILESSLNETALITIELISGTKLMDLEKKSRSFQDLSLTYYDIIKEISSENNALSIVDDSLKENIAYPLIQYVETDWEFIKRIVSHKNLPLISYNLLSSSQFYCGFPKDGVKYINPISYKVGVQTLIKENKQIREIYAKIQTAINLKLGQLVNVHNQELIVYEKQCTYKQDDFYFEYLLNTRNSCYVDKKYNNKFIGTSLLGNVIFTGGEFLRLHLDIDKAQDMNTAYNYQWTPVSGNVFYLMPTLGTTASLYFANECEGSGKCINIVRKNGGHSAPHFSDVTHRELVTEHNKSIYLYSDYLKFESVSSDATPYGPVPQGVSSSGGISSEPINYIDLKDTAKIEIYTQKQIYIVAKEEISIISSDSAQEIIDKAKENISDFIGSSVEEVVSETNYTVNINGKFGVYNTHGELVEDTNPKSPEANMAEIQKVLSDVNDDISAAESNKKIGQEAIDLGNLSDGANQRAGTAIVESSDSQLNYLNASKENLEQAFSSESYKSAFPVEEQNMPLTINSLAFFNISLDMGTYSGDGSGKLVNFFATEEKEILERENDAPSSYLFDMEKAVSRAVVGVLAIAVSIALVPVTGGFSIAGAVGAATMAFGGTSIMIAVGDIASGTNTSDADYLKQVGREMAIAVLSFGISAGYVSRWLKCGMENAFKYVLMRSLTGFITGGFESALRQLSSEGSIEWEAFFKDAMFSAAMSGLSATVEYGLFADRVCFPAGTLIHTSTGLVPIEEIKVSTLVLSRNLLNDTNEYKPVTQVFSKFTERLVLIEAENDIIKATPSHPFYDVNLGWTQAKDLTLQSKLFDKGNNVFAPSNIDVVQENVAVYNFEVMSHHNYFVGLIGWLVHNRCPIYTDAEMDELSKKYAEQMKANGEIDWDSLDDNLSGYMKDKIRQNALSKGYVTKGLEEHHFASNKNASYSKEMAEIADKYGLDLDSDWNKKYLPHSGRHPDKYHEFIIENMKKIDKAAKGDVDEFLRLFNKKIANVVSNDPSMLYSDYWKNR